MPKISLVTNAGAASGVGGYAFTLAKNLRVLSPTGYDIELVNLNDQVSQLPVWPGILSAKPIVWLRAGKAWQNKNPNVLGDIVHLTNQSLSFLAGKQRSVVTVHDIFELTDPQTVKGRLLYRYLYGGIKKAGHIIAVSAFSARTVQEYYNIPADRITVIPNGANPDIAPIPDFKNSVAYHALKRELHLEQAQPIILFVGSDHPRKNLPALLQAVAQLKISYPQIALLKVGLPGFVQERVKNLEKVDELNVHDSVHFLGEVSNSRLNELYNLADVVAVPSLAEGFGLAALEALAAGRPAVVANTTALPEVVGSAALLVNPERPEEIAVAIEKIIKNPALAADLKEKGLAQASKFTWRSAAEKTLEVYKRI